MQGFKSMDPARPLLCFFSRVRNLYRPRRNLPPAAEYHSTMVGR